MSPPLLLLLLLVVQTAAPAAVIVGPWSITRGNDRSCMMSAGHADGTVISFIRRPNGAGALAFSNSTWAALSKTQEPYIRIGVNESPYRYYGAKVMNGAIVSRFDGTALNRLGDQKAIGVLFKGKAILTTYTGGDTPAAIRQLDACAGFSADPFAQ